MPKITSTSRKPKAPNTLFFKKKDAIDKDADLKIAILKSLFDDRFSNGRLRVVLKDHKGDVEACTDALLLEGQQKEDNGDVEESTNALLLAGQDMTHIKNNDPKITLLTQQNQKSNAFTLLKQPNQKSRNQAITLKKDDIPNILPCSYLDNFLPGELANELLSHMLQDSKDWSPLPVVLFGKQLISHHTTALYSNQEVAFFYQGSKSTSFKISPLMKQAADLISKRVAHEYTKRDKLPCEPKEWVPDLIVANLYDGPEEHTGAHTDKLTHIGPRPVIASMTLGAGRTFRIISNASPQKAAQSYDILLEHNSLLIMYPPCQVICF